MKNIGRRSFLVLGALAAGGAGRPAEKQAIGTRGDSLGDRLAINDLIEPAFVAEFKTLPNALHGRVHPAEARQLTDPSFQWIFGYIHAVPSVGQPAYVPLDMPAPAFSWLEGELATYPNADAIDASGYTPFSVGDGVLTITADRAPASIQNLLPATVPHDFVSGALSSYPFSQTYGYFEMRGRVPSGRGLWPAFWLLPVDMKWPPEIDVMEVLGDDPATVYTTLHSRLFAHGTMHGYGTKTVDLSADLHLYGVDWGPERVRYYLDRRLIFSRPTPGDWHVPFYMMVNLAVGGPTSWPGAPDASTRFPARLQIASIKAWQRRAYLDNGDTTKPNESHDAPD
jgi:beta-glucanase (GH16 family)